MFGTCVYFFKKSWTYVRKINFLIWTKIKLYPFVALHLRLYPFYSLTVWPNPCTPKSPSTPQSIHGSAELHGRRLSFTVVGLCSKIQPEIELDSPPTQHSKIQVRIWISRSLSMGFGFCFLLLFFVTNQENPFFLFFVYCWDGWVFSFLGWELGEFWDMRESTEKRGEMR